MFFSVGDFRIPRKFEGTLLETHGILFGFPFFLEVATCLQGLGYEKRETGLLKSPFELCFIEGLSPEAEGVRVVYIGVGE